MADKDDASSVLRKHRISTGKSASHQEHLTDRNRLYSTHSEASQTRFISEHLIKQAEASEQRDFQAVRRHTVPEQSLTFDAEVVSHAPQTQCPILCRVSDTRPAQVDDAAQRSLMCEEVLQAGIAMDDANLSRASVLKVGLEK